MKILISTSSFAEHDKTSLKLLESHGFDIVLNPHGRKLNQEEVVGLAKDCQGIIAGTESLTNHVFKQLTILRAISRCGTGMDSVDLEAARNREIAVRNTPDASTQAVAELALGFILNLLRGISFMDREIRNNIWEKKMGTLLNQKTVGIIGLGRIGKCLAELLEPFKGKILASEPAPDVKWMKKKSVQLVPLGDLLRKSDIVSLHMPYSKENNHFIDMQKLKIMKNRAFLINTSRGGLVDEDALYNMLKDGHLGGAAIDTFKREPYNGPLKELNNVILTSHIGSYALEARVQMELDAAKNMIEMLEEKE